MTVLLNFPGYLLISLPPYQSGRPVLELAVLKKRSILPSGRVSFSQYYNNRAELSDKHSALKHPLIFNDGIGEILT